MAKGGARPGAGRPRKPLWLHERQGTYRPDRHGALPANVVPMPQAAPEWQPAADERASLGPRAQDWLNAVLGLYAFDAVDGRRLLAALRTLTRIEAMEIAIASAGVAVGSEPHALLAALAREQRIFLSQWAALQLGREQ